MHTITLTRNNVTGTDNNRFVYNIPGSKNLEGAEIALVDLYMYYSWQNINVNPLANNTLSIIWPAMTEIGGLNTTNQTQIDIVIPDGLYEVSDINSYLQQFCIDNNYYLINSTTSEYVYFIQLQTNPTRYAVQANSFTLPDVGGAAGAIPAGYSAPAGGLFNSTFTPIGAAGGAPLPGTLQAPGWFFPANFSDFAGFSPDTYLPGPGQSVYTTTEAFPVGNASAISTQAPNVQPNNVIFLNCNLISNAYTNPQTFLYPVPAKVGIGELITIDAPEYAWNKLMPGQAAQLILTFTDVAGQPILLQDPNTVITLIIRDNEDKHPNIGHTTTSGKPTSMEMQRYGNNPMNNQSDTHHHNLHRKIGP